MEVILTPPLLDPRRSLNGGGTGLIGKMRVRRRGSRISAPSPLSPLRYRTTHHPASLDAFPYKPGDGVTSPTPICCWPSTDRHRAVAKSTDPRPDLDPRRRLGENQRRQSARHSEDRSQASGCNKQRQVLRLLGPSGPLRRGNFNL